MLYLEEVTIHNFKSFKHTNIKFNKGFTCIVGPNGSGKSNVCDSLLFALGETSLRRMRVNTAMKLINTSAKANKEDGLRRGYVKVKFSGDHDIEIARMVKSNKKVAYRLNGKRATRQEIIELLKSHNSDINETNTITQDEIKYLLSLNPKGRRELIDIAAGIKEFNDKKDAALKELEKVDERINEARAVLGERSGFLHELEKDKIAAEKYNELSSFIKRANYTVLKMREKEVLARLEDAVKGLSDKTAAKTALEKAAAEIDAEVSKITADKDKLSKSLNAKSGEAASTNKIMEETNKNIAVLTTQASSLSERMKQLKEHIETMEGELKKIKAKEKENKEQLRMLNFEIDIKSKNLPEISDTPGSGEAESLTERFNANSKKLEESESKLVTVSMTEAGFNAEHINLDKEVLEMHREMNEAGAKRTTLTNNIKSSKEALSNLERNKKEVEKEFAKNNELTESLRAKTGELHAEQIELREQLAMYGKDSDRANAALKKGIEKGFHGRVIDICSYDDKYAMAVQAAAGARMNYFVVDSIDEANEGIKILKAQKLGRASFIPIKDVVVKEARSAPDLAPLLDSITFDKKFRKAMEYVFSNTYIADGVKEAQKKGIGSYRYVTLEGDLVEPSGIVSGGATTIQQSAATIAGKLKKVESDIKATAERLSEANVANEMIRKKIVNYDMEITNYDIELKHALSSEDEVHRKMDSLEEKVKAAESRNNELKDKLIKLKREREAAEIAIKALKIENTNLRNALDSIIASKAKGAKSKEEQQRLKTLRDEIEKLRMSLASITKENELQSARAQELDLEIKKDTGELDISKKKSAQIEKELANLEKQKSELQTSLEGHGKTATGLLKQMQELEDRIFRLSAEKGKQSSELDKATRNIYEFESAKAQHQTRLNDIKAELLSYANAEMIDGAKLDELDQKLIVAKADLERLGSVNLKAPEMYEQKKKDVDEAQQRMDTLGSEKDSILSMIGQIETKKLNVFNDTLRVVNENYKKLYSYIFDGTASLYLENPKDPFNSGLKIDIEIGRKKQDPDLLSGGQKSLTLLMLIFAIQMRRPMSFYIFDEIDSALDKENSKKLSKLIKELSDKSQFIVVSHNDSLIAAADTAIGVVKRPDQESQVVGIQLSSK